MRWRSLIDAFRTLPIGRPSRFIEKADVDRFLDGARLSPEAIDELRRKLGLPSEREALIDSVTTRVLMQDRG